MRIFLLLLALGLAIPRCNFAELDLAAEAERNLFSANYEAAADSYARLVKENPVSGLAHDRLVRSLLAAHLTERAYAAAEEAVRDAPGTAPVITAQGRVALRKGNLPEAEQFFRKAIVVDPKYPGALTGLAEICSIVSRFKAERDLLKAAYSLEPRDPDAMLFEADQLKGAEHEAQLKKVLASLDPASKLARQVRAHIMRDAAMHGRKRKLISPAEGMEIKLLRLTDGPGQQRPRGVGVKVQLNGKTSLYLKLDTGAGGISLSPAAAKRAGLENLADVSTEALGIGNDPAGENFSYLADRLKIGDLEWENYSVSVFRGARSPDTDGLIGTDVFARFRVTIDFPAATMSLEPRAPEPEADQAVDAVLRPEGYSRVYRFGHLLTIPTSLNDGPTKLFVIDSGASGNLVNIQTAEESSKVRTQDRLRIRGIQGNVKDVRSADKGTITFAGFKQENPGLTAMDLRAASDDTGTEIAGLLGMPVLWHLKLTIDYASGSVKLERSAKDWR